MCALEQRQMKAAGTGLAGQGVHFVDCQQFQVVNICMPTLRTDHLEGRASQSIAKVHTAPRIAPKVARNSNASVHL
jgi:hypothetical protein